MVNPSGMRLPQGQKLKVEQVDDGLFSVENAYEGEYEYFDSYRAFQNYTRNNRKFDREAAKGLHLNVFLRHL